MLENESDRKRQIYHRDESPRAEFILCRTRDANFIPTVNTLNCTVSRS